MQGGSGGQGAKIAFLRLSAFCGFLRFCKLGVLHQDAVPQSGPFCTVGEQPILSYPIWFGKTCLTNSDGAIRGVVQYTIAI